MAPASKTTGMVWGGRFARQPHPRMLELTRSVDVDMRLLGHDIKATQAHARALAAAGLLRSADVDAIDNACADILRENEANGLGPDELDEDVHTFLERELTRRLGGIGAGIHAGRSRNDLVATDLRLWCKEAALDLNERGVALIDALVQRADEFKDSVMPGYTHLQRAQSIPIGFHLLAHAFSLARDVNRFEIAWNAANVSPLGAGALAGTTLGLDPSVPALYLGFRNVFDNAMDAVSDRDFACDLLYAVALCGVHLARLAEEIVLWSTSEFSFARLPDEWSTGSSMMPHKRNPDIAELVRGRAAGGIADLTGLLTLIKGLPLAYNRDLQEDKGFVFRAADRLDGALDGMTHLVKALEFDVDRAAAAATNPGAWATELAEVLTRRGVPFREAHAAIGRLVAGLERDGKGLADASQADLRAAHPLLVPEDVELSDPHRGVQRRDSRGGSSPDEVIRQIHVLRERVAKSKRFTSGGRGLK
jgi:argininosuccinate lyase